MSFSMFAFIKLLLRLLNGVLLFILASVSWFIILLFDRHILYYDEKIQLTKFSH